MPWNDKIVTFSAACLAAGLFEIQFLQISVNPPKFGYAWETKPDKQEPVLPKSPGEFPVGAAFDQGRIHKGRYVHGFQMMVVEEVLPDEG